METIPNPNQEPKTVLLIKLTNCHESSGIFCSKIFDFESIYNFFAHKIARNGNSTLIHKAELKFWSVLVLTKAFCQKSLNYRASYPWMWSYANTCTYFSLVKNSEILCLNLILIYIYTLLANFHGLDLCEHLKLQCLLVN